VSVPVDTAAFKEAVVHHALAKEKKGDCQGDQKQKLPNCEPARPFWFRGCLIRVRCHVSYLSPESGDSLVIAIERLTVMLVVA
jgi:hypothetical protein